ncbi:hypothetical protein TNCV_437381 [Trichonephila clavipes]|nr:hypothetical protein TNCV_437381 [Trichonephila clavipes]
MSQQRDLPESMAWRVIGRLESRQTQRSVADAVESPEVLLQGSGIDSKKQEMLDVDQGQKSWLDGMGWNQHSRTYRPAYHLWHFDGPKDDNKPHSDREHATIFYFRACMNILGRRIAARPRPPATVQIAFLEVEQYSPN